mgnify:CR=1 FL=1
MQSTSIGKITEELINRSPFLRESMTENLINISALARKLQPEIEQLMGRPVKEGAIVNFKLIETSKGLQAIDVIEEVLTTI